MADRVADRTLEQRGIEAALEQEVGHPEHRGLDVDLEVVVSGEHDHRRVLRPVVERAADEVEAGELAEAVVDQVDVVAALADQPERRLGVGRPLDCESRPVLLEEQVAREDEVVLVVLDDQDPDLLSGGHPRHPAHRFGSSTISNQ